MPLSSHLMSWSALIRPNALLRWGFAIACLAVAASAHGAEFTDSAGRHVELPATIARATPAGPPADVLLYALAPETLVGLVEPFKSEQRAFAPAAYAALPKIPRITGKPSDADLQALKSIATDVIIDYGDVNTEYAALADRMQAALGAPYLLLDGKISAAPTILRKLGEAFGRQQRAADLAAAVEHALARLSPLAAMPEAERVAVYYGRGVDGLQAIRSGSSLSEGIALAGGRNVIAPGRGAMLGVAIEDVARLQPSAIILANSEAASPDSPLRKALPPNTRFLVDRGLPFAWVENPPSLNRLIGALALAEKLYPDRAKGAEAEARALADLLFSDGKSAQGLVE